MGGRHVGMSLLLLGWLVGAATGMAVAQGADGGPSPQPIDVSRVRFEKREDVELLLAVQREALELRRAGQRERVLAADRRGVALVRALRARLAREPEALVLEHDPWLAEREFKFLVDVQGDLVLLGRFEEGLATAREVRASQAFHADSAMGMESCRLEAEAQFGLLQYEKSLRTLEAGRVSCEGAVRRMLAEVRSLMGATRLDDSQALAVRDFYESAWDFRGVVRRIIQTLYSLGAWEEALAMYDLEVLQELDAVLEDEKALALLAQAYANVGGERFAESMVGRVRALNRMRRVESALSKAGFLREMAAEQPDPGALSKQALEVLAPLDALVGDDPICRAAVRALRGSILAEMGKPAEGLSEMQSGLVESARVVEPFLRHALEFRQQMGLTRVCLDLGRLADAHAALGLAEKAAGSTPADEDLLVLADLKGRILLKEERYTDAVVALREAVRLTEKERMGISIPAYRQTFFRRRYRIYERYIRALHGARRDGEALEAMEMMRARTLLDALGGVMVTRGVEPDLARRMKLESAQEREQAIAENRKMASSGPARLVTRGLESARLDSERTVTYAELIRTNPELAQLHAVSTVRTDQILRHVPADSVLLEFHVGEGFRAVMVAGAGRPPRLVELPCSYRELHEEVRALRKAMRSTGASRWRMSAERLYTWLLAPVEKDIQGARRLIIVPHDVLNYLPWSALAPPGAPEGTTLLDRSAIVTLPCSSVLEFCSRKETKHAAPPVLFALGNLVSAAGPALPGTLAEVDGIASLFKGATVYKEQEFTVANLKRARGASIIHLATHGVLDMETPRNSAIITAEGPLKVEDIFNLDLSADLVVLSACETGRGRVYGGDEIVGLTRAFMYAGTPSVLASLWSVSDESTSRLMARYYAHLQRGLDKAEALRQAQVELRKEFESPFHWASFVLQGSWK